MLTDDSKRFLDAVFGPDWRDCAILAEKPLGPGMIHMAAGAESLDPQRGNYWSQASFPEGSDERLVARALGVRALVVDDVGTKVSEGAVALALGRPTKAVATSAGNQQWTYRLSTAVAVDQWGGFFDAAEALVGAAFDRNTRDAVHLFRLPQGVNVRKDGYAVHLVEDNPDVEINPGTIPAVPHKTPKAGSGAQAGRLGLNELRGLMGLIPNDAGVDRDKWVNIAGHGLKALCKDDEDGFTTFDEWSQQHASYDAAKTRTAWGSFGVSAGLMSKGGNLRKWAQETDPDGFRAWEAKTVFDDGEETPALPLGRARVQFILGEKKQILSLMENAARGITGLGIACAYDEFHHRVFIQRPDGRSERLTDNAALLLRVELNEAYGKDFGAVHIGDAVMALALQNGFNPVTDMLASAEAAWDGAARLDRLGPDYFHASDTELARACFRKTMIAAVRRARRPGCKFDQILVTESPEGWDKSSAWAVLAGEENFSDADILGKDARAVQEELADVWVHEIADLSGLTRAEVEHVKAFASRTNDRARPAYGRHLLDQPRQSVEVGTTNAEAYLISSTGNRRFWPFRLSRPVDLKRLRADRLQIWGEAARAESGGETLVLDEKLWVIAGEEQEKRRVVDVWEDELANLAEVPIGGSGAQGGERIEVVHGEHFISSLSVVWYLERHRGYALNASSGRRIAEVMRKLGWERVQIRVDGQKMRGYKRPRPATVPPGNTVSGTKNIF